MLLCILCLVALTVSEWSALIIIIIIIIITVIIAIAFSSGGTSTYTKQEQKYINETIQKSGNNTAQ
jgi:uncharacterized protein YxeA